MSARIWLRRAYDPPTRNDGYRVLVDRIWPRGVSRDDAAIDHRARELAPSDDLRRWFNHDPGRWDEFQRRYRAELEAHDDALDALVDRRRLAGQYEVPHERDELDVIEPAAVLRRTS